MASVTWTLEADLDRSGSFSTDWTSFVERPGAGVKIFRGIGDDGVYRVSRVAIDLSNKGGEFTPTNTASAYYGRLEPGVPIRLVANHSAVDYTLWTGYVDRYTTSFRSGRTPIAQLGRFSACRAFLNLRETIRGAR